jgi:hypothetical protein
MPDKGAANQARYSILDKDDQSRRQMEALIGLSDRFGESMSNALAKNIAEGKKFDDVLKNVRQTFTEFALRSAIAPLKFSLMRGVQTWSDRRKGFRGRPLIVVVGNNLDDCRA